jgi:uncharacterized protein (TIGR00269 family)
MHCRKCGQKAVINLFEHRLALCKDHFLDWLPEYTEKTIKKYSLTKKQERIIVAVSGGKDSLSLWDILWRLGYSTEGIYINLGIECDHQYSKNSEQFALEFASQRQLKLFIVNLESIYKKNIIQIANQTKHGLKKPCSACGHIKRYILNKFALEGGYDALATAHNLDDEVAALMVNSLNWSMDLLKRQSPFLPARDGFARKVKPFCRTYEREAAAYAILRGIKYVYEECPYSHGNPQLYTKQILNQPGLKLNYYLTFLKAKEEGFFLSQTQVKFIEKIDKCLKCGQITSNKDGICSFCRLIENSLPTNI